RQGGVIHPPDREVVDGGEPPRGSLAGGEGETGRHVPSAPWSPSGAFEAQKSTGARPSCPLAPSPLSQHLSSLCFVPSQGPGVVRLVPCGDPLAPRVDPLVPRAGRRAPCADPLVPRGDRRVPRAGRRAPCVGALVFVQVVAVLASPAAA